MRAILIGLAGLALAACGESEGSDQKTYGAKPTAAGETAEQTAGTGQDTPDNQEIAGEPTGMSDQGGEATTPGEMSHNQSQPMQAAQ